MGSFSSIPSTAAIMIASRGVRGGSGIPPDEDPEKVLHAFFIPLYGLVGLMVLFIVWMIVCDSYGTPTVTRSDCGTIAIIDARPYKSRFIYNVTTTGGCSTTFYRNEPVQGETLYVTIRRRPLKREVTFSTNSGCTSGYSQLWPLIRD